MTLFSGIMLILTSLTSLCFILKYLSQKDWHEHWKQAYEDQTELNDEMWKLLTELVEATIKRGDEQETKKEE